ncbi:MAG: CBS domain-containing protein [Thermoguttaceae bacterium]
MEQKAAPTVFRAEDFMTKDVVVAHPEMEAYDAILLLLKHKISGMPVVDDRGEVVGIISERDCLKTLVNAQYHELPTAFVKDLMSTEPRTITPHTEIMEVAEVFLESGFRRLPVLDEGRMVGLVSRRDVLRVIKEFH